MVDVLVVAEAQGGAPSRNTLEALGAARALAGGTQGTVTAAVQGAVVDGLAPRLFAGGADTVLWVEHPMLETRQPEAMVAALVQVVPQAAAGGPDGRRLSRTRSRAAAGAPASGGAGDGGEPGSASTERRSCFGASCMEGGAWWRSGRPAFRSSAP